MKRAPKVVIVGAGPAGSSCALWLAKFGKAEVTLLDKSSYPRKKVCGSGLSPHALHMLERLELRDRFADQHASISALRARGPAGSASAPEHDVYIKGGTGAWVVPRTEFDHVLASEAQRQGVDFRTETKVTAILRDHRGEVCGVQSDHGDFEADFVICANGSPSRFAREKPAAHSQSIRTIMGWWRGTDLPKNEAIMVWDRRLEGYYAWSFPEPDGVVNIGLTIPAEAEHAKGLKVLFEDILDEHFGLQMPAAEQIGKWMGHPATVSTGIGDVAESRALWIGEAAGLVSPGTVEGISFALQSGILAAELLHDKTPGKALTWFEQQSYRGGLMARMIPKFLAAEAFVRVMRSETGRDLGHRLVAGSANQSISNAIAFVLGDSH